MYLFFDTETTGLPKNWQAPANDVNNWPRIIQLAWALYDVDRNLMEKQVVLIKPEGWQMPTDEFWVKNGFTQEKNMAEGVPIKAAIGFLIRAERACKLRIAHNIAFDSKIVRAEVIRTFGEDNHKFESQKMCTMMASTDYCKLPGKRGYKWPKLIELHEKLFGEGFTGAHDAMNDVEALAKCFFKMVDLKIIG